MKALVHSRKQVILTAGISIAYFSTGLLMISLQRASSVITPVIFLPEGIGLAAALQWGRQAWIGIVLGQSALALYFGNSLLASVLLGVANASLDISASLLARRFKISYPLISIESWWKHLALVSLLIQPLSALLGHEILSAAQSPHHFMTATDPKVLKSLISWWCGNTLAQITLTPLLLNIKELTEFTRSWRNCSAIVVSSSFISAGTAIAYSLDSASLWTGPLLMQAAIIVPAFLLANLSSVYLIAILTLIISSIKQAATQLPWEQGLAISSSYLAMIVIAELVAVLAFQQKELKETLAQRAQLLNKQLNLTTIASGVAHEIRQPLALLRCQLQDLDSIDSYPEKAAASLALVAAMEERSSQINQLLKVLKSNTGSCSLTRVFKWVQLHSYQQFRGLKNVELLLPQSVNSELSCRVGCDHELLCMLVDNLIRNAHEACQNNTAGKILIKVSAAIDRPQNKILLSVEDNGPGFTFSDLHHKPEPLYTTKPDGTGLGLYLADTIVQTAKGSLRFGRSTLGGALVEVKLPLYP